MTDYCNQEREISLVDIFALCLRKFVVLALCACEEIAQRFEKKIAGFVLC